MNKIDQNSIRIAFFSSSDFTLPMINSLYENEGKLLSELAKTQWQNLQEKSLMVLPRSLITLDQRFWNLEVINKPIRPILIVSQPVRELRGKSISNPIVACALKNHWDLYTPEKINNEMELFESIVKRLDLGIVASFGQILSTDILDISTYGFINWHPSKLPLYRGPSPVQETLKNGDSQSALSWIEMTEKMDAGDIYLQIDQSIPKNFLFSDVINLMAKLGGETWAIVACLKLVEEEQKNTQLELDFTYDYSPLRQDYSQVTFTKKIDKSIKSIDVHNFTSHEIFNHFRAYSLFPGTWMKSEYFHQEIKITAIISAIDIHDFNELVEKSISLVHFKEWYQLKIDSKYRTFFKCKNGYVEVKSITLASGKSVEFSGYKFELDR
jgi:methionyl-tRNA formyltransferase